MNFMKAIWRLGLCTLFVIGLTYGLSAHATEPAESEKAVQETHETTEKVKQDVPEVKGEAEEATQETKAEEETPGESEKETPETEGEAKH